MIYSLVVIVIFLLIGLSCLNDQVAEEKAKNTLLREQTEDDDE
jgi:hypothetical protein